MVQVDVQRRDYTGLNLIKGLYGFQYSVMNALFARMFYTN